MIFGVPWKSNEILKKAKFEKFEGRLVWKKIKRAHADRQLSRDLIVEWTKEHIWNNIMNHKFISVHFTKRFQYVTQNIVFLVDLEPISMFSQL